MRGLVILPLVPDDLYGRFIRIVKVSFAMRRKTIQNNLKALMGKEETLVLLEMSGVDPGLRAEQLPPGKFIGMAEVMQ